MKGLVIQMFQIGGEQLFKNSLSIVMKYVVISARV